MGHWTIGEMSSTGDVPNFFRKNFGALRYLEASWAMDRGFPRRGISLREGKLVAPW